jgi:putative membrane protein
LLGALFTFSPRLVYAAGMSGAHHSQIGLADQQLAGLMMIVACPLTYVLAAVVIASRWLFALELDGIGGRNA